ncbi:hypothetical protein [Burkholderia pseudomallei]|uniref:hypothetical protein n=1 Tax=Burkholderia pseudomallei TaxID=28450 RepID=UPI001FCB0F1C|nr:hypothetical protein [Burkholderia pseudomallei]
MSLNPEAGDARPPRRVIEPAKRRGAHEGRQAGVSPTEDELAKSRVRAEQRKRRMRKRNFTRLAAFFCETVARVVRSAVRTSGFVGELAIPYRHPDQSK